MVYLEVMDVLVIGFGVGIMLGVFLLWIERVDVVEIEFEVLVVNWCWFEFCVDDLFVDLWLCMFFVDVWMLFEM